MTSQVPNPNSSVIVDSRITDVTVYSDQAKITRKGQINLTGQERELILTKLPIFLKSESIRVTGQGSATVQILGVR